MIKSHRQYYIDKIDRLEDEALRKNGDLKEIRDRFNLAKKALTNISKDRMGKDKRYMVEVAKKALEEMNQ